VRAVLTNLLQLGGMQLVIAVTAVVRNKVLAVRLGSDGLGEFMQLALVVLTLSVLTAFGFGMSLNRNAAAAPDDAARQRLLAQANAVNLALSTLLVGAAAALLLWRPELVGIVGLEPTAAVIGALAVLAVFVPVEAAVQHRVAFLTGAMDIKGMTSGRSVALLVGTAATVPLVWYFGLVGAALQYLLLTGTILVALDRRCRRLGYRPWQVTWDLATFRLLVGFGLASLIASFAYQLSDVVVRSALVRSVDLAENGVYQAAQSITFQVRAIVLGSVGSYAIASFARDTTRAHIEETCDRLLATIVPLGGLAFAGLGLFSGPAVLILYTADFLPAQAIVPILLVADFLLVATWTLNAPLLALGRVPIWLGIELTGAVVRAAAGVALVGTLGGVGVAIGYSLGAAAQLLVTAVVFRRVLRLTVAPMRIVLFLVAAGVVALASAAGARVTFDLLTYAVGLVGLAAFGLWGVHLAVGLPVAWAQLRSRLPGRRP